MTHIKFLLIACLIAINHAHPVDPPDDIENFLITADIDEFNDVLPEDYRLSGDAWPEHYNLRLDPYFETGDEKAFTFDGEVTIRFRAHVNSHEVTVHGNMLTIDQSAWSILTENMVQMVRGDYTYVAATHKYTFHLGAGEEFVAGSVYHLRIRFTGVLDDSMRGFYRSYYMEGDKKKWMGSTQFQTTDARRAFPCFDEPKFKAKFDISILRPELFQPTIGNTKILRSAPEGDRILDTFETTPVMSTYLIAFVVQQYEGIQTEDKHYGVFARPGAKEQMDYSFDVGDKLLDKMGEWMEYPFDNVPEIKKLDMIAVPDFSAGAMENWGAMTYRETNLLWDPQNSQAINKQRIAAVLTHEIAHLWFGDLVTCDWWDVTWLNEGFARFFQYFGTDLVEADWDLEEQFVVEQLQGIFQMDSTPSTFPMTNPDVFTPGQVSAMFGSISYNKGASIIRWMQHYMGKDHFQQALRDYIKKHEYGTVVPENLFTALEKAAPGINIANIFVPWTEQRGYPLVTVENLPNNRIKMTQKRFFLNPTGTDTTRWTIPLTFAVSAADFESTETRMVFPRDAVEYTRTLPDGDLGFYLLNVQQVGYYRVNYDVAHWHKIHHALETENFGGIPTINRAQIVDDLFNLAQAGEIDYSLTFDVVEYLKHERRYIPWLSAFNGLGHLSRRIADNGDDAENFESYINYLVADIYEHLGFLPKSGDSHTDKLNRVNVLNWACKHGNSDCIEKSKAEFAKLKQGTLVDPNIRVPVYCAAIREGSRDDFDFLWTRYRTTNIAHEQITILQALGCTKNKDALWTYLDKIVADDDSIRPQDRSACFNNAFSGNHENVDLTLDYLIERYEKWQEKMGNVANSISTLSARFTREEQAQKVEQFAKDKETELGPAQVQTLKDVATRTRTNIAWDGERLTEVRAWMVRKRSNGAASVSVTFGLLLATVLGCFYLI